jgi:hypothetical protein
MATTPSQNPVPSELPPDLKFNAGKIDEYVTSMGWTYTDRFGVKHYTIEGINHLAQEVMSAFGYVPLPGVTFTTGATISQPNEVLFNTVDNSYYKWTGSFVDGPKVVPANSTPASSGGGGAGKWLNVGDTVLRSDLAKPTGARISGYRDYTVADRLDCMLTTTSMGAVGDGIADDTAAIQLAINTLANFTRSASLYIDGRSKITGITIPSTLSVTIIGNNPGGASYDKSSLVCTNTSGAAITVNGAACAFKDLQIVGASSDLYGGGDTTQTGLLFTPGTANNYNCDAHVDGVGFIYFNKIFDLRGRNLKLSNCLFSNSAFSVWIGATGIPDFRGLDIKGCRFHYMSAVTGSATNPQQSSSIFINPESNFNTISISGCFSDGCKWFFVGMGAWAQICSNHFTAQQTGVLHHYTTGTTLGSIYRQTSFSDNTFTGTYISAGLGSSAVQIENGWAVKVVNNIINNASARAVYNKVADSVISGNVIANAAFIDGGYAAVESSGTNASVVNNIFIHQNVGQGGSSPSVAIKLTNFTTVGGNVFPVGFSGIEWDTSSRGDTLIYGRMDIAALPSEEWGTSAPTSGRYLQGSIVWNKSPVAGGNTGWAQVASGTPGTWRASGSIVP